MQEALETTWQYGALSPYTYPSPYHRLFSIVTAGQLPDPQMLPPLLLLFPLMAMVLAAAPCTSISGLYMPAMVLLVKLTLPDIDSPRKSTIPLSQMAR